MTHELLTEMISALPYLDPEAPNHSSTVCLFHCWLYGEDTKDAEDSGAAEWKGSRSLHLHMEDFRLNTFNKLFSDRMGMGGRKT